MKTNTEKLQLRLDREKLKTYTVQTGVKAGMLPRPTATACPHTKGIVIGI